MGVGKIAVDLILIAILVGGVASGIFFSTNTSAWDASSVLVWGFIFVVAVAGLIIQLLKDVGITIDM